MQGQGGLTLKAGVGAVSGGRFKWPGSFVSPWERGGLALEYAK